MQQITTELGLGVGLRSCHFSWLMAQRDSAALGVDWLEIITENFLDNYGYARHVLLTLRERLPMAMHGVSLSIGSTDPLNVEYLYKVKRLADELQPALVSDHLCWTGLQGINSHDLLPMPLTRESLNHVCVRVAQVQEILDRPLVLENPSSYLAFSENEFHEWEFLNELCARCGCALLLDVNNVYVTCFNLGWDAQAYLDGIDAANVVQCHLAGPTDCGTHLVDTHDQPVPTPVWQLYRQLVQRTGPLSTLLEWDDRIPPFPELVSEVQLAREVLAGRIPDVVPTSATQPLSTPLHTTVTAHEPIEPETSAELVATANSD
ncbi:DUF692 domain-containing protein [Ferrimonas kyonanensis]|uniref:MNIO family bufferin maturase n=1 Tax=Ferrimonas kyonanensis TaxID=364763 RepID=UPI0004191BF8|nr:DUF692 domain-containing protein [Ferrimonas kyonanensis]